MSKVLVIEDDPLVSKMYAKVMKFEGINVTVSSNGKEGIEKAKEDHPDLIFCDIMMPEMNGIEVLENLKADDSTKSIPIVMLTNLSGTSDADTAVSKGAAGYLVKSEFKPTDIAQKAKKYLTQIEASKRKKQNG